MKKVRKEREREKETRERVREIDWEKLSRTRSKGHWHFLSFCNSFSVRMSWKWRKKGRGLPPWDPKTSQKKGEREGGGGERVSETQVSEGSNNSSSNLNSKLFKEFLLQWFKKARWPSFTHFLMQSHTHPHSHELAYTLKLSHMLTRTHAHSHTDTPTKHLLAHKLVQCLWNWEANNSSSVSSAHDNSSSNYCNNDNNDKNNKNSWAKD